ncbi:hypothetical protein L249_3453, partial [Ophiocordyceps polyrhachis-furcata BCC 54312]
MRPGHGTVPSGTFARRFVVCEREALHPRLGLISEVTILGPTGTHLLECFFEGALLPFRSRTEPRDELSLFVYV